MTFNIDSEELRKSCTRVVSMRDSTDSLSYPVMKSLYCSISLAGVFGVVSRPWVIIVDHPKRFEEVAIHVYMVALESDYYNCAVTSSSYSWRKLWKCPQDDLVNFSPNQFPYNSKRLPAQEFDRNHIVERLHNPHRSHLVLTKPLVPLRRVDPNGLEKMTASKYRTGTASYNKALSYSRRAFMLECQDSRIVLQSSIHDSRGWQPIIVLQFTLVLSLAWAWTCRNFAQTKLGVTLNS